VRKVRETVPGQVVRVVSISVGTNRKRFDPAKENLLMHCMLSRLAQSAGKTNRFV